MVDMSAVTMTRSLKRDGTFMSSGVRVPRYWARVKLTAVNGNVGIGEAYAGTPKDAMSAAEELAKEALKNG